MQRRYINTLEKPSLAKITMRHLYKFLFAALAVAVDATVACAESCRNTLPLDDQALTAEEVRPCLDQRAKVIVALRLLGERQIPWTAFGTLRQKCKGEKEEALSDDPLVWAVQVSSCPSPRKTCGCTFTFKPEQMMAGSRFQPDNPSARPQLEEEKSPGVAKGRSLRATNLALIKSEGSLATKRANQDCAQIEAALRAMPEAQVRRNCRSLKLR
jgi:hypothetical protein